jgi:hypothetical protein
MAEWRIRRRQGPAIGPFETQHVLRAIRAGKVPHDSQVQRVGQQAWTPIARIMEFSHALDGPPEEDHGPASASVPPSAAPPLLPWDEEDDEATRLMVQDPASRSADTPLPPQPPGHATEPSVEHAARGALRPPKLPPKPTPPGAHFSANGPSPVEQLRDAVEDDELEPEHRLARTAPTRHDKIPSTMAVALPPHRPGAGGASARRPSGGPEEHLPSISVHPDHEQTSPARRALRSTPEQLISRLVLAVIILSIALCVSLILHVVR